MDLDNLIKKAKENKKEAEFIPKKASITVRLSMELNSTIEDLAENQLETSKQKMLEAIIKKGVKQIEDAFHVEEVEEVEEVEGQTKSRTFHLLNTNKRHDIRDGQRMLKDGIAAAFHGEWKKEINKIKENDVVFLYENGVGIIAFGIADGKVNIEDKDGEKNEMYYQKLKNFKLLKEPFKASSIKKLLDRNFVFLKTKIVIHDGEVLFNELEKMQTK